MNHWHLRTKLTAWCALITGAVVLVCGIAALLFIQEEQLESLDDQLRNEAHTFFGALQRQQDSALHDTHSEIKRILPITRTRRYVEIVDPKGNVLYRTKDAKTEAQPRLSPGMHTIRTGGNNARFGVFTQRGTTIYLAADLSEIDRDIAQIATAFVLGFPLLVGFVAFGGWWVAWKALTPVQEISLAAEQITTERLYRRLPEPQARDEIGHLTLVLNAMFDRLDLGFRQSARFSADASHELKTPLAVLRMSVEDLLGSPSLSPNDQAAVGAMLEQVHRLTSITESLLLLSRADSGRLQLDLASASVGEIIAGCVEDAAILAEPNRISIHTEVPDDLEAIVDARRVSQILGNLLSNAVKYNHAGGHVRVAAVRSSGRIGMTGANTGPGIAKKDQSRIFERFYRSDLYPETPGHGLGLSIALELTRAHHGDLTLVHSDPGWTTFELSFVTPKVTGFKHTL